MLDWLVGLAVGSYEWAFSRDDEPRRWDFIMDAPSGAITRDQLREFHLDKNKNTITNEEEKEE